MQQSSAVAAGSSAGSTNNSPMNATFGSSHTNISRVLSQEEDMSSLSPRPLTIRNGLLLPLLLYNLLAAIEDSGGPLGRGKSTNPHFIYFFKFEIFWGWFIVLWMYLLSVVVTSLIIALNLPMTYEKLHCKEKPYRFGG